MYVMIFSYNVIIGGTWPIILPIQLLEVFICILLNGLKRHHIDIILGGSHHLPVLIRVGVLIKRSPHIEDVLYSHTRLMGEESQEMRSIVVLDSSLTYEEDLFSHLIFHHLLVLDVLLQAMKLPTRLMEITVE